MPANRSGQTEGSEQEIDIKREQMCLGEHEKQEKRERWRKLEEWTDLGVMTKRFQG